MYVLSHFIFQVVRNNSNNEFRKFYNNTNNDVCGNMHDSIIHDSSMFMSDWFLYNVRIATIGNGVH